LALERNGRPVTGTARGNLTGRPGKLSVTAAGIVSGPRLSLVGWLLGLQQLAHDVHVASVTGGLIDQVERHGAEGL
jgi:hypothetical protein